MKNKQKTNIFKGYPLLWKEMNLKERVLFSALILNNILFGISAIIPIQLLMMFVNKLTGSPILFFGFHVPDISVLGLAIISVSFLLFKEIWDVVRQYSQWRFATKFVYKIKKLAFSWAITPRKNMDIGIELGDVTHRIMSDTEEIYELIEEPFDSFFYTIFSMISSLIYLSTLNFWNLIIMFCAIFILIGLIAYRNKKTILQSRQRANMEAHLNNQVITAVRNSPEIAINRSMKHEENRLDGSIKTIGENWKARHKTLFVYWLLSGITTLIAIVIILALAIKDVVAGVILASELVVIFDYSQNIFTPISEIGWRFGTIEIASTKVARVMELKPQNDQILPLPNEEETKIQEILFDNVEVKYNKNTQIKNINLKIKRNQLTVISGESGCGKTTIANLLTGMIEKSGGKIFVNGKETDSMYRYIKQTAYLFQEPFLFDVSVEDNIFYPDKPFQYNSTFLKKLKINQIIQKKEKSPEDNLTNKFSGGEKKRIGIARVLNKNTQLVILDEPTNELDETNVKKVLSIIQELKENHLVVVISHDPRLIAISDNLYEFK